MARTSPPSERARRLVGARPWGRHHTEAAAGVGLLGVSWLLAARTDTVADWEVRVFDIVNGLPGAWRWPVWPVMQLGNFWMVVAGGIGVYAFTRRARPALAASSAVLLGWVVAKVVKHAVQRGRPEDLLEQVQLREAGVHGRGYVSGHTTTAFALATVVTPLLPGRWRVAPYALASAVGLARIYYGAHLPLDVVGGAGLGILCGLVASIAFGTIHPIHER
ncbi:MAG TPA: phosphatase PAP2 family protein [Acidimicrobiales bacterium]|nr:phosphatase PAP2 family protein [Acidimicrobiales bacterium]